LEFHAFSYEAFNIILGDEIFSSMTAFPPLEKMASKCGKVLSFYIKGLKITP